MPKDPRKPTRLPALARDQPEEYRLLSKPKRSPQFIGALRRAIRLGVAPRVLLQRFQIKRRTLDDHIRAVRKAERQIAPGA